MEGYCFMREQFIYAVARIRAKELFLLSENDINRLMACKTFQECVNLLKNKGWGDSSTDFYDYDDLLKNEEIKLWNLISELVLDKSIFNIILLPVDYHNLKAAIKGYITESLSEDLFILGGNLDVSYLVKCIKNNNLNDLPKDMIKPAELAFEKFLYTSDSQLCDNIIDKALLNAIKAEGQKSKNSFIKNYAEFYVASTNIKIAIRSSILKKNIEFLKYVLVKCDSLDVEKLAQSAVSGVKQLCEYLEFTNYSDAIPFIKDSLQKFEFWRDNKIIDLIKAEKYNSFSVAPIIAYILARQNEIKVVRIILCGKLHHIEDDLIKERLRLMYA